jgi:pimeloyl-ACP methyl ester carboxylesterase
MELKKSMQPSSIATSVLDIAYESAGPPDGKPVILLHGWPDDVRTWDKVLPLLHGHGFRTIAPYLRGFGATRFRRASTMRSGQLSALARDVLDLADALALSRFAIVGHDWGARAAYITAAIAPDRVSHCAALSVGWGTNDPQQQLPLSQIRNYWYHWYFALDRGARLVEEQGGALARFAWETWGPSGWFTDAEFDRTSESFRNPDWAQVVVHSYRHRWGLAPGDPAYDAVEAQLRPTPTISVATLVLHGAADACNDPSSSAGRERFFSGRYERVILDGVGHFPTRESPAAVGRALAAFLSN